MFRGFTTVEKRRCTAAFFFYQTGQIPDAQQLALCQPTINHQRSSAEDMNHQMSTCSFHRLVPPHLPVVAVYVGPVRTPPLGSFEKGGQLAPAPYLSKDPRLGVPFDTCWAALHTGAMAQHGLCRAGHGARGTGHGASNGAYPRPRPPQSHGPRALPHGGRNPAHRRPAP